MRDRAKIAAGLALFVAVALFPVWQRAAVGTPARPEPKIAKPQTQCVAQRGTMRVSHMQVLDGWRDGVVRTGIRTERTADGRAVTRSLGGTCLECHSNVSSVAGTGAQQAPSGGLGGVPPAFHNLRDPRYRNCTLCHQKIHGSYVNRDFLR